MIDTMSITKAAIGILYHLHEEEYKRDSYLPRNLCTIGNALNMHSGISEECW